MQSESRPICLRIGCGREIGSLDAVRLTASPNPNHNKHRFCFKCRGGFLTIPFRQNCIRCKFPFSVTRVDRAVCDGCRPDLHKDGVLKRYRELHPYNIFNNPTKHSIWTCIDGGITRPYLISRILNLESSLVYYHVSDLVKEGLILKMNQNYYSTSQLFR